MQKSSALPPSDAARQEAAPAGLRALRRLLVGIAAVTGVLGVVCVGTVVGLGLAGRPVPPELVGPFLILLPLAVTALVAAVIVSAIQRRHT